jgi:hypothetical protein
MKKGMDEINKKMNDHVQRMEDGRLPKEALHYQKKGRGDPGRLRMEWRGRNRRQPYSW